MKTKQMQRALQFIFRRRGIEKQCASWMASHVAKMCEQMTRDYHYRRLSLWLDDNRVNLCPVLGDILAFVDTASESPERLTKVCISVTRGGKKHFRWWRSCANIRHI